MKVAVMKRTVFGLFGGLLLLSAGSCADPKGAVSSLADASDSQVVFVSVTEKGAVTRFFNRVAGADYQVSITKAPVAGAAKSARLEIGANERLMLVELQGQAASLPGERWRSQGFALVSVPAGRDPHEFLGTHMLHVEDIAERETTLAADAVARDGAVFDAARRALASDLERTEVNIDRQYLEAKLKEFSGAVPVTVGGRTLTITERRSADGRNNARAWLRQQYESLGFTVSEHRYGSTFSQGVNFIAERAGSEAGRFVLLTSHIDSVGNAGADDDGSGTISNLAIAAALKDSPLRYGLRVVGFDQEENGLLGSSAYARGLNDARRLGEIVGVVNVEMTGYDADDDGAFHAIDCNENTSADLSRVIADVVARDPLRLRKVEACTNRSDHAPFWRYDVPAIVVSQNFFGGDSNPCYHQACDRVDRVNFDYMTRMTIAVGRGVAALVEETP